jgi:phage terminase large subunit-like protein
MQHHRCFTAFYVIWVDGPDSDATACGKRNRPDAMYYFAELLAIRLTWEQALHTRLC